MGFILDGLESEAYDRNYSDRELLARIVRYFRPYGRQMLLVAGALMLSSVSFTAGPIIISRAIDQVSHDSSIRPIVLLSSGVLLLGVLGWFFNYVRQYVAAKVIGNVVLNIRQDVFAATIEHDLSFYDEHPSGKIVSRVTSDTQDFSDTVSLVMDLLSQIMIVLILSVWLLRLNVWLTLLLVGMSPLAVALALSFRRLARRVTQRARRVTAKINAQIQESISGIVVAKTFRQEQAIYATFEVNNRQAYYVGVRRGLTMNTIFPIVGMTSGLAMAAVLYAGGQATRTGGLTPGNWYLFIQAVGFYWWPMLSIASFWSQFQDGLSAAERVFALIDAETRVVQIADEPVERLSGQIDFRHLRFSYLPRPKEERDQEEEEAEEPELEIRAGKPGASTRKRGASPTPESPPPTGVEAGPSPLPGVGPGGEEAVAQVAPPEPGEGVELPGATSVQEDMGQREVVLPDFSLDIHPREKLAIVGHTGAGKSSLARLITRFYEFQGGELLVDGRDIRRLDLAQYRQHIGLVPQEPFLFSGTVRDNIRYARPEAGEQDVLDAAMHISNGEWLSALPKGLDTDVGERGANLSMGQRQLVALARVLLKDPAIFILDEATASVDPFTEAQIQEGLETIMRDRTAIIIAHRLSTVKRADRIIVMREGRIIEEGTHDELLARGGHYAELYNTYFRHQSLAYIEHFGEEEKVEEQGTRDK